MKSIIFSFFILSLTFTAHAAPLEVEYKGFYSHMRKLNADEITALQFSFGFLRAGQQRLCELNSVTVRTQKQDIDVEVTKEQRFTLPYEEALKLADAVVVIDTAEPANVCDMSVQLETKPAFLKNRYTVEELTFLFSQYEAFFDDMGGMFSFLMPKVDGLVFHFNPESTAFFADTPLELEQGRVVALQPELASLANVALPGAPYRITAHTE